MNQPIPPGYPGMPQQPAPGAPGFPQQPQMPGYPQPAMPPQHPAYPPQPQTPQQPQMPGYPHQQQVPQQQVPQQPMPGYPAQQQPMPGYGQQQAQAQQGGAWANRIAGATLGDKSGDYFREAHDGDHVLDVHCCKVNTKGTGFIVEMDVVQTTSPNVRVGSRKSYYCDLTKDAGNADALRFYHTMLEHILGAQYDANAPLDPATIARGTSEEQPFAGYRLHLNTDTRPQKNDKTKDFTHHNFEVMGRAADLPPPAPLPPAAPPGVVSQLPPMPNPAALPPAPAQAAPQQPMAAPQQAPAGAVAGLPPTPPANWPAHMHWPGAA